MSAPSPPAITTAIDLVSDKTRTIESRQPNYTLNVTRRADTK
jgi:hypothetical protein